MSSQERNVFLYWIGKEYKFISILRNLIYLHSTNGVGYNVVLITHENINDYINNIPEYFYNLCPAHQADIIRVNVILEYGGIWIDSDTIVLESLDSLFDLLINNEGFFIKEDNIRICNGVFGSKKGTNLMKEWKEKMDIILNKKKNLDWNDIGSKILDDIYDSNLNLFKNYKIFNGVDNLYPVSWKKCVRHFIITKYKNYKNIIRKYQPLIILVNDVYKELENKTLNEILNGNMPINYFINKSFENMQLIDYNFIEITTSNYNTLIEKADNNTKGLFVNAVKCYIDKFPEKSNIKKINIGISDKNTNLDMYYIPEKVIEENKLPNLFKWYNCIGNFHPLHIKHNVTHLCKIEKVKIIPCYELFYKNKVKNVKYLKIDTKGNDCIILKSLYNYLNYLPSIFYPQNIVFESKDNENKNDVKEIIILFNSLGYKLQSDDYQLILLYKNN